MEHRWGNRTLVNLPVWISGVGVFGAGILRDVSISGAFLETSLSLASLKMVRVEVRDRRRQGMAAAAGWGFVVRHDANGIGIEWCDPVPVALQSDMAGLPSGSRGREAPRTLQPAAS